MLQVKAKGYAPALKPVEPTEAVIVKLESPSIITGRVIDTKGKPIPDAFVAIDTWRGYRSLGVFLKSDRDGKFRWDDAPPDTVVVNASATGFKTPTFSRSRPARKPCSRSGDRCRSRAASSTPERSRS